MKPFSEVIELVRKRAERDGDHVARCVYYEGVNPNCIIGHVLQELGVFPEFGGPLIEDGRLGLAPFAENMVMRDGSRFAAQRWFAAELPWDKLDYSPTPLELEWVGTVQGYQDKGNNWRDSVAHADRTIGVM